MPQVTPIEFLDQGEPSTPAAGYTKLFTKTGGLLFTKDDSGLVKNHAVHTPAVEGVPFYVYGDSWAAADVYNTLGGRWWERVARRMNLGQHQNYARGGNRTLDFLTTALCGRSQGSAVSEGIWVPGTKGIVLAGMVTGNDQFFVSGTPTTKQRQTVQHAIEAFIRLITADSKAEANGWTTSGTWAAVTDADYSNGGYFRTTAVNAYVEFTTTALDYYILEVPTDGTNVRGMTYTVKVDGVTVATRSQDNVHDASINGKNIGYRVIPIENMGAGTKTIRITATALPGGAGSAQLGLDCGLPGGDAAWWTKPAVVLVRSPKLEATLQAEYDAWNQAIDDALASASTMINVSAVDANEGFDPNTMLGADELHPNDRGESNTAERVVEKLATFHWTDGLMVPGAGFLKDGQTITWSRDGNAAVAQGKKRWRADRYYQIEKVLLTCWDPPTGADLIVQVLVQGEGVFETADRPRIVAGQVSGDSIIPNKTRQSGALQGNWILKGEVVTVDIAQIGSTNPGTELVVELVLADWG